MAAFGNTARKAQQAGGVGIDDATAQTMASSAVASPTSTGRGAAWGRNAWDQMPSKMTGQVDASQGTQPAAKQVTKSGATTTATPWQQMWSQPAASKPTSAKPATPPAAAGTTTTAQPASSTGNPLQDWLSSLFGGSKKKTPTTPTPTDPAPVTTPPATQQPTGSKAPKLGDKTTLGTYGNTNSAQAAVGDATLGTPDDPDHIQTSGDNVGASRLHATANIGYVRPDDPVDPPTPTGPSSPSTGTMQPGTGGSGSSGNPFVDWLTSMMGGGGPGGAAGGGGYYPGGAANGGSQPGISGPGGSGVFTGGTGGSQSMGGPDGGMTSWFPGGNLSVNPDGSVNGAGDAQTSYFPGGNLSVNPDGSVNGAGNPYQPTKPNIAQKNIPASNPTQGVAANNGLTHKDVSLKLNKDGGYVSDTWDPNSGYDFATYDVNGNKVWFKSDAERNAGQANAIATNQASNDAKNEAIQRQKEAEGAAMTAASNAARAAQQAQSNATVQARMNGSAYTPTGQTTAQMNAANEAQRKAASEANTAAIQQAGYAANGGVNHVIPSSTPVSSGQSTSYVDPGWSNTTPYTPTTQTINGQAGSFDANGNWTYDTGAHGVQTTHSNGTGYYPAGPEETYVPTKPTIAQKNVDPWANWGLNLG